MFLLIDDSQGLYAVVSDVMTHLKQQYPPHTQHAKVRHIANSTLCCSLISRNLHVLYLNSSGCCAI